MWLIELGPILEYGTLFYVLLEVGLHMLSERRRRELVKG